MKSKSARPTLLKYIGGPWALVIMGLLSLIGMGFALFRRKQTSREIALAGDKAFTLSQLTGTWYELAHATTDGQPRRGISFEFFPVAADEIRVARLARENVEGNGRLIADEAHFLVPDVSRPWEMILLQADVPDENLTILYSDPAGGVLLLGWDGARNMLLLHDQADFDNDRYEALMQELKRRAVPVQRFTRTPQA